MSSEFVRRCVEVVVAKTLEGLLCHSIEGRGLGVLGDLLQRFVEETGRRASAYRDLAGRASGALPDVLLALHDLGTDPAALLAQITPKLAPTDKLPKFPAFVPVALPPSLVVDGDDNAPFPEEAPEWLPALPPKHAYVQTLSLSAGKRQDVLAQEERKAKVEGYLERAAKRSRPDEDEQVGGGVEPVFVPATIDQAWADAHAARRVKGTRVTVEQGPQDEDENEYQLRLKAERIVSRRENGE